MKTAQFLLTIRTAGPLDISSAGFAAAVNKLLPAARVEVVRIRRRETLIKYADPASMHRIEPDAAETWTARCKSVSAAAKAAREIGSPVRVVKISADGYFGWLGNRQNTEDARREYADWVADHRTRTITEARRIVSRENGKRGGRPRKTP